LNTALAYRWETSSLLRDEDVFAPVVFVQDPGVYVLEAISGRDASKCGNKPRGSVDLLLTDNGSREA